MNLDCDYVQSWLDLDEPWDESESEPKPVGSAMADALQHACDTFCLVKDRDPELARMPYQEYLRTPHWRDTRIRALQRAGYQCKRCEARGKRLDVHHLTYARLGRELESDLTVLCEPCHARAHIR